jgi:hypothetical protein
MRWLMLATLLALPPVAAEVARLANERVEVRYDLATGLYDVVEVASGAVAVQGARATVEGWSTRDAGTTRSAAVEACDDALGRGQRLLVRAERAGAPTLLTEFRVYPGEPFVVLRQGLRNTLDEPLRVKSFAPLAGGDLYPGAEKTDPRSLDGPSGAHQPKVTKDLRRTSTNVLLVTFRQDGRRRSTVLGALATAEFLKSAALGAEDGDVGARVRGLGAAWPGVKVAAWFDCGAAQRSGEGKPRLSLAQGKHHTWPAQEAPGMFASVAFHEQAVVLAGEGLDPARRYVLGWSWWDWDGNGRVQSVKLDDGTMLATKRALPAQAGRREGPAECAAALPAGAYADGRLRVSFTNDAAAPNAVVCEAWLWETPAGAAVPAAWTAGRPVAIAPDTAAPRAALRAADAVGKPVAPGADYLPDDSFYLDVVTANPHEALEGYGRSLRLATGARPNPYDFPTVCAWYAGVWKTRGAQNHPEKSTWRIATTPGLVEEMEKAAQRGFLRYSRLAGRLVPDNYTPNNPNGWWDDEHWRQQGFYVAPYDTSRKWGEAMAARGGLAFTYFQPDRTSADFRAAHPELLVPGRQIVDYTNPATIAHLRGCYAALRGAVRGMMFDYCDETWGQAQAGGFADPDATAVTFYRNMLRLGKEGLGLGSWIHERAVMNPPGDLALGIVDSQRTSWDTDKIDAAMVSRSGLRWYKNRTCLAYDMDSKELLSAWKTGAWRGSDDDGRRMLLTMAYVAASRLLLANSLRDLPANVLSDLERTFPYPTEPRSARPVDAFVVDGWPRVYDYAVDPTWHQLTLFNTDPGQEATITVPLAGDSADGALGLDPKRAWWVYDFWHDRLVGKVEGKATLTQTLRAGEARQLALHAVEDRPQLLSTNRHLMQGLLDLAGTPRWDAAKRELSGAVKVVGGETFRLTLALNGCKVAGATGCRVEPQPGGETVVLCFDRLANETAAWRLRCE